MEKTTVPRTKTNEEIYRSIDKRCFHTWHAFLDRKRFTRKERKVAVDRGREHNEIRRVFCNREDPYSRRGHRHCWRDSLFRTPERGISQPRWPRAWALENRAWISDDGGFLALAPRVVAFDTHAEPYFARKIPDNYLRARPSCDATRRSATRCDSPRRRASALRFCRC